MIKVYEIPGPGPGLIDYEAEDTRTGRTHVGETPAKAVANLKAAQA